MPAERNYIRLSVKKLNCENIQEGCIMALLIKDICLNFGSQVIFDHLSCSFATHDRIGLVGANGSGKSTLLRIIAKQQAVDSGTIQYNKNLRIGYMPQEITLASSNTIIDEAVRACQVDETEQEALKAEAKKILTGLGFELTSIDKPVSALSVGWRMRVLLAQLLLQKADFYLFDEPTNHLDIVAQEWFLTFLKNADFGFMLVCHDRHFLDHLCSTIFELEQGVCTIYRGNYSFYQTQKEQRLEILNASYKNQQRDIEKKQQTIERFRAQASRARMVKKMERDLEKIDRITLPSYAKTIHFSFPPVQQPGKIVLDVQNLAYAFGDQQIFKNITFNVTRNERVAIIAPNGAGKTTLLNLITGKYTPLYGSVHFGHKVTYAYFEQDHLNALDQEKTILETVNQCAQQVPEQEIRDLLGGFLFSQTSINKKIKVLSGGEKNRVCMTCTLLQRANFLILDEPTNHLDIQSKEILLYALKEYTGTVLFVSHDHYFVQQLATSIVELNPDGAYHYPGTYEEYLAHKQASALHVEEKPAISCTKKEAKTHKQERKAQTEIEKIERKIQKLEREIASLHQQFEKLTYGTPEFSQAAELLQKLQKELEASTNQWEQLYTNAQ